MKPIVFHRQAKAEMRAAIAYYDGERDGLFDPFRRGSSAPSHARGLGLGLFIVQQIARAHGGDVRVESGPRRTVFTATLQR